MVRRLGEPLAGWRGLLRFWVAVLSLLGASAAVMETLGPPRPPVVSVAKPLPTAEPPPVAKPAQHPPTKEAAWDASQRQAGPPRPGRDTPGSIADADPALLEPTPGSPNLLLPKISADGRAPMSVYAAGFDATTLRPRVGLLLAGIGMSEADSMAAIKTLPGAVTLAISPNAGDISRLLSVARLNEHEYLLSVPMEPLAYPVNDPDDRSALMTSLSPAENLNRLQAFLAKLTGYVGVTNALGPMRGERLAGATDLFDPILVEIAARGLLFLDARTGQKNLAHVWNRSVDMVLDDDPLDAAKLDQRLDALTHLTLDKGSALGLVSVPRPMTLERVAAWTSSLPSKGLTLAPVSALVLPPAKAGP
jgi:polysaccharide deacetylase 2 family uncharacterized protein YibQ